MSFELKEWGRAVNGAGAPQTVLVPATILSSRCWPERAECVKQKSGRSAVCGFEVLLQRFADYGIEFHFAFRRKDRCALVEFSANAHIE